MKTYKKILCAVMALALWLICSAFSLKKDDNKLKDFLEVSTTVTYSSGEESNWAYGNQRKEFPKGESCYVRVGSTAITPLLRDGSDTDITVSYIFSGTKNCSVELSEGVAKKVKSADKNTITYSKTLSPKKSYKASEEIAIFKYMPNRNAAEITVQVVYDDHVGEQYDTMSTVYFTKK